MPLKPRVDYVYNCKLIWVFEDGLAEQFVAPQNSEVDFEELRKQPGFHLLSLGPFDCKPL